MRRLLYLLLLLSTPTLGQISTASDFFVDVAKNLVPYHMAVQKFGRNNDIDSASGFEDIWAGGGTRAYLTSAETVDIVSDSANDTAAGTGARTITVNCLDANYDRVAETVTLNGLSSVTTTISCLRLNRAYVNTAGSVGSNDGAITFDPTTSGSGSRQGQIAAGDGQTLLTHYTVPRYFTGDMVGGQISISSASGGTGVKEAVVQLMMRPENGAWRLQQQIVGRNDGSGTTSDINFTVPITFTEKTDIRWRADADNNNTSVYVQYNLLMVHDFDDSPWN